MKATPATLVQITGRGTEGDSVYRAHQPAEALARMGAEVYEIDFLSRHRDEAALAADLLLVYQSIDIEIFRVLHLRRLLGKPSFCEINDYFFDVQPWNPVHGSWSNPRHQNVLIHLMARSDALQVSSPGLADRFARYNPRIGIFPNHIARLPAPPAERSDREMTLGWGGSAGHLKDVERVAPALAGWIGRNPGTQLAVMGDPVFEKVFAGVPTGRLRFERGGSLQHYLQFLDTLDVGIAPLLPTEYNRCRSDVKFLEYASHGAVPVMQRLDPYMSVVRHGETGLLFDGEAQLIKCLDALAASPSLRGRLARTAFDYVRRERLLDRHIGERWDFYQAHAMRVAHARPQNRETPGPLRQAAAMPLQSLPGLEKAAERHFRLGLETPAERKFEQGLQASNEGDLPGAMAAFAETVRLAPDFYQAHYYLGRCFWRQGRVAEAERAYRTAARINPLYSRPLSGLSQLYGRMAAEYERRSAELNPPLPPQGVRNSKIGGTRDGSPE